MADEVKKEKALIQGTFSADDVVSLIKNMAQSNQDALKEFAAELAYKISHPEPTVEQQANIKHQLKMRIERAKEEDAQKDFKRKHCVHPARPNMPHRRYGTEWGMFNGTSVIAWHYTNYSSRTPAGTSTESDMRVALGVCQWCGTEFKPGDPGYEEALTWGLSQTVGNYQMNQRTGIWC